MGWWGACGTSVQKHKQSGVLKLIEAVKPHNRLPDKHVNITVVNKSQFHTNNEAVRARKLVKWPLELDRRLTIGHGILRALLFAHPTQRRTLNP